MEIHIKSLSPGLLDDFFQFFDGVTFEEHPHWSVCYCRSFHFTGTSGQWNREENRAAVKELVAKDRMKGYLAYVDGNPVGWCNANNRLNFQRLVKLHDLIDPGHPKICAIVCFLVHPDYRRKGIARLLLDRITMEYSALGYQYIEAYPEKDEKSCETNYKGHIELYMKNGFQVVGEMKGQRVVRKSLPVADPES